MLNTQELATMYRRAMDGYPRIEDVSALVSEVQDLQRLVQSLTADAKLGRLVRSMPDQWFLSQRVDGKWQVSNGVTRYVEDTPENALINAGCSDV